MTGFVLAGSGIVKSVEYAWWQCSAMGTNGAQQAMTGYTMLQKPWRMLVCRQ